MNNKAVILFAGLFLIIAGLCMIAIIKSAEIKAWLEDEKTKEIIRNLCREAEKLIVGTKKGQERLAWCVEQLKKYVPDYLARYITVPMLIKAINIIFDQIAVVLRDGSRKAI